MFLLELDTDDAIQIFGETDALKLKSSMTLFSLVSGDDVFRQVLERFFDGKMDEATLRLVDRPLELQKK